MIDPRQVADALCQGGAPTAEFDQLGSVEVYG
jgi:hypothetical protein